jgi:hypothetical protein
VRKKLRKNKVEESKRKKLRDENKIRKVRRVKERE